ncbi:hypothetical protein AB7M56_003602 [Bradyrhizobium elkanii]
MRTRTIALLIAGAMATGPILAQHAVAQNLQNEADKGAKTRNSGESGYVGDQDRPGAARNASGTPRYGRRFPRCHDVSKRPEFRNRHRRRAGQQERAARQARHGRFELAEPARPGTGSVEHQGTARQQERPTRKALGSAPC